MPGKDQAVLKECRAKRRVSLVNEVACQSQKSFGFGESENVSEAGMMVRPPATLPPNSEITVRFFLPVRPKAIAVEVKAKVIWVRPGAGMGIQFLDLKEEFRKAIATFVQA